jgi:uncharacterized membrane protein YhaH (DUF805 family)
MKWYLEVLKKYAIFEGRSRRTANLVLYCTDGTEGPNKYGSDPKRPEFDEFLNDSGPGQSV